MTGQVQQQLEKDYINSLLGVDSQQRTKKKKLEITTNTPATMQLMFMILPV